MRPILTRRDYWWLAFGFLGIAVYGSLVPFDFHYVPFDEAFARFREALSLPVRVESRSDWAANILLLIPPGFLLTAALAVDRAWQWHWVAALAVIPTCALFSATIEFTQLYFPPRVTSVNDIVAESLGGLVGTGLWLLAGPPITSRLRQFWVDLGEHNSTKSFLPAYIVFLVVVHALPLDLTISPVEVYHKYRAGRVNLIPFFGESLGDPFERVQKYLTNAAFFLPVGWMLAGLPPPFWRQGRSWLAILGMGLTFAGLIELMQLFVYSRYCDVTDVITGGGAVLAGWVLGLTYGRGAGIKAIGRLTWLGVLGGWLALLVFVNWRPFDFNPSGEAAGLRLQKMPWIPFADYEQGDYINAFDQICSKTVLFMPVGMLLAFIRFGPRRHLAGLAVLALALAIATILEAGQLFLPSRYASVSDVLIETFGAWLGYFLACRRYQNE